MSFAFGQARELTLEQAGRLGHALRSQGRPVALVCADSIHAGHLALIDAAARLPRGITILALTGTQDGPLPQVDAVVRVDPRDLYPAGPRTRLVPADHGLEDPAQLGEALTQLVALAAAVRASDVVVGEKDYEFALAAQQAMTDLHQNVTVRSVPTVRMPGGLAVSHRNVAVPKNQREAAVALSAALTAGAHVAERGYQAVLDTAAGVLAAAGVAPDYLELRDRSLRRLDPQCQQADARLLVAATFGPVRLVDNVGVPLGVGFKNLGDAS
ncbi:pantoate--beta-alanine ligase [Corynebacterium uberis]|uniref:pantoate--beta-alanine ligase n=1 Tax=Corynebacterium TaxID=1716 RepID=UPI001D0B9D5D|nr:MULTISPECIES: pantoate--beta-alanine ligase [Corynebacterium]MCZ9309765.1 pantoate--beta-alanine ligase [Corynebacterium sp. c6VSa_13]UDL73567.1 pantoate--beta-alanine ligase [Corynebacterium uberis]UDL75553.1 pantoate--beta-alanine ligase [Corynebacterium uberis]UDL77766.1 pantoate--beta-alanine ligase [Corynebacterium uberis]UDL80049.1 pantoate--beta-alanine ligase [Corynebacterium uberis]